jgi:hypothetical protein
MFRVFTCLTGEHDLRLVLLAGMVCLVASIVAINIFHRAIASQTGMRFVWIAIAGAAIGYGIWATHFIAMLAYEPGISTGYGIVLTASSLAAAMLLTSGGFGFAAIYPGRCRAPIGDGIIGAGIACMHYLGMWALEVPGRASAARSLSDISGDVSPSRKNDKSLLTRAARSIAALRLWRETMARFRTEAASRSAAAASEVRIATRLVRSILTKDVKSASGSRIVFAQGLGGRLKNLSRR